jgi:hypothetical protein
MNATRQRNLILIVTIFVMTLSLVNPGIVFADEGQPPVEPAITEEPVAIDVPVSTDTPTPITDSASTEETVEEEESVQEILEQIPADMKVIVLNEGGEPEPMATEAAAETILASDPIWCPTNQIPGDPGCTDGYATAAELIAALNGVTGDGTIYFTSTYSTNDLTFDHTNANLAGLGALTIQGGWNGSTGNAFALSGSTTLNGVGLSIINWTSAVTINDINVIGNIAGDGLQVVSYNDITLDNISSSGNGSDGVYLNNCNGIGFSCSGSGNITISGTNTFYENTEFGLRVYSAGEITANNITSINNTLTGAAFYNFAGTGGDVTLTGTNTFNNNDNGIGDGYGLGIQSNGVISLNNITANNNAQFGVFLENNLPGGSGDIIITGINTFNDNDWGGINAVSNGNIRIENVTANNNGGSGLGLGVLDAEIEVTCGILNNNGSYGVAANTSNALTLNGVIFSGNVDGGISDIYGGGILVENPFACGGPSNAVSAVKVEDNSSLPENLVNVASGESVELDCEVYRGTRLTLSNGSSLLLPCPISGSARLTENSKNDLPGALPQGSIFQNGFTALVNDPAAGQDQLSTYATLSFLIPEGVDISTLSILYWNGVQWVEVDSFPTGDGLLEALVNHMGTFVLVSK